MRKRKGVLHILLFVVFCGLFLTGCRKKIIQQKSQIKIDESKDFIENSKYQNYIDRVNEQMELMEFHGSVLVAKGNTIILAKGYGLADEKTGIQNTMNTTFEYGSITKQMTAAAILQLQEQGKLSTADTLSKYFPKYKYGKQITLRMLLQMHSGLFDYIDEMNYFYPKKTADKLAELELKNQPVAPNIVMKYFYKTKLKSTPGETFKYCNTNYYLLAEIIEQVSGMSYKDYMKKYIFDKCHMNHANTEFQNTDAKGYDPYGRYYSIPASIGIGCGDVNGNVIDLFKWNRALVECRVINKDSFEEMTNPKDGYGYGLFADRTSLMHGGSTDVFNSMNMYYQKEELTIIVLVNAPTDMLYSDDIAKELDSLYKNFCCTGEK